jgi:hypothetical protein
MCGKGMRFNEAVNDGVDVCDAMFQTVCVGRARGPEFGKTSSSAVPYVHHDMLLDLRGMRSKQKSEKTRDETGGDNASSRHLLDALALLIMN